MPKLPRNEPYAQVRLTWYLQHLPIVTGQADVSCFIQNLLGWPHSRHE